ncbi:S-adenosyl-L-methionine-dependent methyltransferase [Aspergillus campestris IBT 28561]|uniref:S-adenosyl-L-methionine-dependent methyltransferase n=1 Tax=Aspergillus campestris (strain IBT 28561) TaxID=1392248 RepID=A0A2I1CU21_ASPC2|nr:S-adenosyl-L-methionine-dependent methyltransferase [Aspergillus campestris IBT 28561]PKY01109.1 S-adenosyl-L-methionine-dependent methyltransferase [Aspergillus campestris IBT 28561]
MDVSKLANTVSESAQVISDFLQQQNLKLSFNVEDPDATELSGPGAKQFHEARRRIYDTALTLADLMAGDLAMLESYNSADISAAVRIANKFRFAHAVPLSGSISYDELAESVGLSKFTVQRVMYTLMGVHIFHQPKPNNVAHTRLSHKLATYKGIDAYLTMGQEYLQRSCYHIADALAKWGSPEDPRKTGFNIAMGTDRAIFEYAEEHKELHSIVSGSMEYMSSYKKDGLISGFDWKGLGDATVVDVGGSLGHASKQLAQQFPRLRFIVQDFEVTCQKGEAALPDELRSRISFQPFNMFEAQPALPDRKVVYLLCWILHDWSDTECSQILRSIAQGMKAGDRIIISEFVRPEPGAGSLWLERAVSRSDTYMLSGSNGRERTTAQFEALPRMADPRLRLVDITLPSDSWTSVIEMAFDEEKEKF